jgi:ubiquitin C-terminal hydrolase
LTEHSNAFDPTDAEKGHFVAYVKSSTGWWVCNDSYVRYCSPDDVLRAEAYLLFYERVE